MRNSKFIIYKNCLLIVLILYIIIFCNLCSDEEQKIKILSNNSEYIEIMSYGHMDSSITNYLNRRYSSKAFAIKAAEEYIKKKFEFEDYALTNGYIIKEEFMPDNTCRIIFKIEKNKQ